MSSQAGSFGFIFPRFEVSVHDISASQYDGHEHLFCGAHSIDRQTVKSLYQQQQNGSRHQFTSKTRANTTHFFCGVTGHVKKQDDAHEQIRCVVFPQSVGAGPECYYIRR